MKDAVSILIPLLAIGAGCGDDQTPTDTYESYCIAAGTRVHTPEGTCAIESLEVGRVVLSVDPRSGEVRPARVVAVRGAKRECVRLRLPGGQALVCTGDHPLYDPDAAQYAPATDWIDGRRHRVAMLVDGRLQPAAVEGHDRYVGVHPVYDVGVDGEPHSFVASGCLVHNKSVFYCDTSYGYDQDGQCVMLSSTGIGDATFGETDGSSTATGTADDTGSGTDTGSDTGSGTSSDTGSGSGTGTSSDTGSGSGSGSSGG